MSPRLEPAEAMAMRNTLCEGCGQHSFLIPLHGGKGGPLHPGTLKYSRTSPTPRRCGARSKP